MSSPRRVRRLLALLPLLLLDATAWAKQERPLPFQHTNHVRKPWIQAGRRHGDPGQEEPEYDRDCRGCHDYDRVDPKLRVKPADVCKNCHGYQEVAISEDWRVDPSLEDWSKERDDEVERFNHYEHRKAGCFTCHGATDQDRKADKVPAEIRKGSIRSAAACGTCHGLGEEAEKARDRFDAGIDRRLAGRDGTNFGSFRHDQHLDDVRTADSNQCLACHGDMPTAGALELGKKQFTVKKCKECHEGGTFELEPEDRPSRTAATFLHQQHLSAEARKTNEALGAKGCLACHAYDPDRTPPTFDLLGEAFVGRKAYDACVACHESFSVVEHGSTDDCRLCHDFHSRGLGGLTEVWKPKRAEVRVARAGPASFSIGAQAHPGITGAKIDLDCARCHKAPVHALRSRLEGQPFSHATHLSDRTDDDFEECMRCHSAVARTRTPAELALAPEPENGLPLYEKEHCRTCHRAAELAVRPGPIAERTTCRFSHDVHAKEHPCVKCHVVEGDRIEIPPEILACTGCHDHATPATTSGHSKKDIQACVKCHQYGVPEHEEEALVPRLLLASIQGKRTHPHAPDKDCSACHKLTKSDGKVADTRIDLALVYQDKRKSPHLARAAKNLPPHFEGNRVGVGPSARTTLCIDCHWQNLDNDKVKNHPLFQAQLGGKREWKYREENQGVDAGFPGVPWEGP